MPLCPQITNTPITVTQTADFTVSSVLPVVAATTTQVDDAIVLIDGKTKAYYQATMPSSGMTEGDIWFDTDDGNKQYYYTGSAWVSVQDNAIATAQATADSKIKTFYQTTAPTATGAGDVWFDTDDGNKQYRWSGSAWVSVQDTAIAAATSASAAATAAAAAATSAAAAAQSAATAAQTTADGKNRVYRQTTQPSGGTYAEGDLWFDTDDDNKIYRYTSGSWGTAVTLGNNALASISANKITAGTIDASVITVSNINAGNISTGTLNADRIASASITGTKIAAGTITAANITAGTITSTEIATGTITASDIATGTITATQIASSTITGSLIAAGTITATNIAANTITASQIAAGTITATQIAAGTITTDKLVAGTLTGFLVQTSAGSNSVSLVGSSNSLTFKNGGSNVGHIVPLSSNGVIMHYGATADGSGGTFPQMFVGSANASMSASSTISIGASTSIGINLTASTGGINLNSQTNYTGIATGAGSTMVVVTTGSRIAYTTSSERFKQDIQYIASPGWLDKVMAMKPITYKTSEDFTVEGEPNETQYGFLAEDIYDLGGGLEKAVVLDPLGEPFSLSYDRLTVFLTLAIKELKAEIDQLKGE